MKAIRVIKPGELKLCEESRPIPKKDQVVCKVKRVGICGTDYGIYKGEFASMIEFPLRIGHEWAGIVDEVGSNVTYLKPGDRVVGESATSCGVCDECLMGNKYKCEAPFSVGTINAWDGAMCEYELFPARDLIKIPDGASFEQAALVEPAANAYMAIAGSNICPGDSIVIMGTGPIGIAAVAIAKIFGATKIISVGRSDYKLNICKKLGATHTINTRNDKVCETIMDITNGKGCDVSIELSGAPSLLDNCFKITRSNGILYMLAFYEEPQLLDLNSIILQQIVIKTAGGGWGYFHKVIELMESGVLDLSELITSRISLDEAVSEIINLRKDNAEKIKVMICME